MRTRAGLLSVGVGVVALLVLAARWLAYALAQPSPLANRFQASAGGPRVVVVALVSLGLAGLLSATVLWLAATAVRERQRLRPRQMSPRLRLGRAGLYALGLFVASSAGFALFESYLHWRAGIGFHGLSCLVGPVHRNAIPILAALALVAAASLEAGRHLLAWLRAAVRELLRPRLLTTRSSAPGAALVDRLPSAPPAHEARPRAPPLPA
ncbi:MAG TPA: hypothetical protein VE753_10415 [Gaiellaceae bacterium]|nr:hypothetical protein [Gaiellaceae bacterium]